MSHSIIATALLIVTAATSAGCATQMRTKPDDITVSEHHRAAAREAASARDASKRASYGERGAAGWRAAAEHHAALALEHVRAAQAAPAIETK